jgi:uncharacterized small protein (DUF1192 family)
MPDFIDPDEEDGLDIKSRIANADALIAALANQTGALPAASPEADEQEHESESDTARSRRKYAQHEEGAESLIAEIAARTDDPLAAALASPSPKPPARTRKSGRSSSRNNSSLFQLPSKTARLAIQDNKDALGMPSVEELQQRRKEITEEINRLKIQNGQIESLLSIALAMDKGGTISGTWPLIRRYFELQESGTVQEVMQWITDHGWASTAADRLMAVRTALSHMVGKGYLDRDKVDGEAVVYWRSRNG